MAPLVPDESWALHQSVCGGVLVRLVIWRRRRVTVPRSAAAFSDIRLDGFTADLLARPALALTWPTTARQD